MLFLLNFEKWHSELSDIRNYTKASFFNLVNDDDWRNSFDGIDDKNQLKIAVKPNIFQPLKYDISKKLNTFYNGVNQANDINKNFNETISKLVDDVFNKVSIAPNTHTDKKIERLRLNYRGLVGGEKVGWSDATKYLLLN